MIRRASALAFVGLVMSQVALSAQQGRAITVGAVTRDSGLYVGPSDISNMKDVNEFLNALESDLAAEVANKGAVQYQDRSSVQELFHELHLSSSNAFDSSTGAARGLLGRLDFLVIIDAINPSAARMRLIDVESGAVRAVESCEKRFAILGFSSKQPSDCVPAMARRIDTAAQQKAIEKTAKSEKLAQDQAEAIRAQKERAIAAQHEQAIADARLSHQAEIARASESRARLEAEADIRRTAAQSAAAKQAIQELRPGWDETTSRLSSAKEWWFGIQQQMAASGQSLRPEIQSLLRGASADAVIGNHAITALDAETLKTAESALKIKLDKLEGYK